MNIVVARVEMEETGKELSGPLVDDEPGDWQVTRAPQTRWGRWWELHPAALRTVTVVALAWGGGYISWRLLETGRGTNPEAFYLLWVVELYSLLSLVLLAWFGWRWSEPRRPSATPGHRVDVFVTTYNEPVDVVEATLAGCAALRYPHETFLLDDGRRSEMAILAEEWGARYMSRPDNTHAKAGNINHALGITNGDLIFCLDADHVPLPDALDALVGYFDDDKVALVQSPHDFYNQDSVQHYEAGRHEQSMFFEVICPGKDRHNGVFWCGSAALLRRAALVEIGGVSIETIAEDFHSTAKMHRAGWTTRYHDEILVQGLAPQNLDGYLLQRDRWARGNLAVLHLPESPLSCHPGLGLRQRLSYIGSVFAYGAGVTRLLLIGLLVAVLVGGVLPARMSVLSLAVLWAPWTMLAVVSTNALCRGHLRLGEASHNTLLAAAVFTRALRCVVLPSRAKFKVTPKVGVDAGGFHSLARLRLVTVLGVTLALSLVWRALALFGYVHARTLPQWAATFVMALGTWELYRIVHSLRIVFRRRQRRAHPRFGCLAPATIANQANELSYGRVIDVSVSGVGLLVATEIEEGSLLHLEFALPDLDGGILTVTLAVAVQSVRSDQSAGWRIGASITEMDGASRANLVRYCYVVHPCARLRKSRLESQEQTVSSLIAMDAGTSVIHAAKVDGAAMVERPAVG